MQIAYEKIFHSKNGQMHNESESDYHIAKS